MKCFFCNKHELITRKETCFFCEDEEDKCKHCNDDRQVNVSYCPECDKEDLEEDFE